MSLTTPKHILQSRKNGCTWNSKGSVSVDLTDITLCPVEYMGEQCPDAFWGIVWKQSLAKVGKCMTFWDF